MKIIKISILSLTLMVSNSSFALESWNVLFEDNIGHIVYDKNSISTDDRGYKFLWLKYITNDINAQYSGEWKKVGINCSKKLFESMGFKKIDRLGNVIESYEYPKSQNEGDYKSFDSSEPELQILQNKLCEAIGDK